MSLAKPSDGWAFMQSIQPNRKNGHNSSKSVSWGNHEMLLKLWIPTANRNNNDK